MSLSPEYRERFLRLSRPLQNPLKLNLYFLGKLPLALFAGLRVEVLQPERCQARIRYGWRNTNPFRSMYFAAQAMAAELSTGAIALMATRLAEKRVALIVTGMEAEFVHKADGLVTFTCEQGEKLIEAVAQACARDEQVTATVQTVGTLQDGTVVSRFVFTWSFKART